jgi:hypothetical protein
MSAVRRAVVAVTALAVVASGVVAATADGATACSLGGPAPGARVLRLDLPSGADDVTIRLRATAQPGRRLVAGVFLVRAGSHRVVAYRIRADGVAPANTLVRSDDNAVVDSPYNGPAAPFARTSGTPVPGLRPGSYYVAGFGSGTSTRAQWGAEVAVDGEHTCTVVGDGSVFGVDASQSHRGTAVTAPAASSVHRVVMHWHTDRSLVVGVMQATQELAGTATLEYSTPTSRGRITDMIRPFASTAGRYRYIASTDAAAFASLAVTGAAFALPDRTRTPR